MITTINTSDTFATERPAFLMDILNVVDTIRQLESVTVRHSINVQLKPQVFLTHFTIEIITDQATDLNVVFRTATGEIVRMFNWKLIAGANVTTMQDLGHLVPGIFKLEFFTTDATLLLSKEVQKD